MGIEVDHGHISLSVNFCRGCYIGVHQGVVATYCKRNSTGFHDLIRRLYNEEFVDERSKSFRKHLREAIVRHRNAS